MFSSVSIVDLEQVNFRWEPNLVIINKGKVEITCQ